MKFGPGTLITAAFIGPGTVTVCTLSGFNFGYDLLWVLLIAGITTIVFQNMAARIGVVNKKGISEVVAENLESNTPRIFAFTLIITAILIGNAAYEAGNIAGGALGIEVFQKESWRIAGFINPVNLLIGVVAFLLLWLGNYKSIERILIFVVAAMALCFLLAAAMLLPPVTEILKGLFIPSFRDTDILSVIALVGTTVVPYNLFLHAAIINEAKNKRLSLNTIQNDTIISVTLGVVISMSIVIVAAAVRDSGIAINKASDLARGIELALGSFGKVLVAIGLFAAGITSAITAPMAAGYAISGLFNKSEKIFKYTWITVLATGMIFSTVGFKSIFIIRVAQIANGLLLPIIAVYLFWMVNSKSIMGSSRNNLVQNILGGIVLLVVTALSIRTFINLLP